MRVFVLDNQKQPLMPCKPARARKLLRDGKAAIFRRFPFTIILKQRAGGETQPVAINVDPGSKQTGVALIADFQGGKTAIFALHIVNGNAIHLECSQLLIAEAKGHGSRQMCRVNKFGFPRTSAKQKSEAFGFKTGDLVTASVPEGARKGFHSGRVAIRASGYFDIQTSRGAAKSVSHRDRKSVV